MTMLVVLLGAENSHRELGSDERRWDWRNFITYEATTASRWSVVRPDKELGYSPRPGVASRQAWGSLTFDDRGLRAHHRNRPLPAATGRPVLVVGDSYAMGEEVDDDETLPAYLEGLLGRPVLNAGVFGYGLDQIVLRAEKLVPVLRPDRLVVSFIADDMRRTEMKVMWGVPKPYFEIVGSDLQLRNVPVPPPFDPALDPVRAVLGYSFLADVVARRLQLDSWWLRGQASHAEAAHGDGERVSCLLMGRLAGLASRYGTNVTVVAQYTPEAFEVDSTLRFELGGTRIVLQCAKEWGFDVLDSWRPLELAVQRDGLDRHYVGKHMSSQGNRLIAEWIAGRL
jgi:hypothetical protein